MAYVTMSDGQYRSTLGPYGTPGWQFARPGWGKNMAFSAANPWVGVGGLGMYHNKTRNDLVLPRYAQTSQDIARNAEASLSLESGGGEARLILPQWSATTNAGPFPPPPYDPVAESNYLSRYYPTHWSLRQGGTIPLGGGCSGCGLGASTEPQYGVGEIAMAGAGGLLVGMLLTYFWMTKK